MAAWFLVRADLRRRWPAALVLGVLIGLASAVVVTGVAGARRGPAAFDEFVAAFGPAEVTAFPAGAGDLGDLQRAVADAPGVAASDTRTYVVLGVVAEDGRTEGAFGGVLPVDGGQTVEWPTFITGRSPAGPLELAVNERVAQRLDLAPGNELALAVYGADQIDQVGTGRQVVPTHGVETFTVSGIYRSPSDLQVQQEGAVGTVYDREGEEVLWTAALWDRYDGDLANYGVGVLARVAPGGDPEAVAASITADFGDRVFTEVGTDSIAAGPIRRVIDLQSTALLVAVGVVTVVALALGLQALSRQLSGLGLGHPALSALGVDRRTAGGAAGLWGLLVGLVALPVMVGGSLAGSQVTPIGLAARADLSEGVSFDGLVTAVMSALMVGSLVLWGVLQGRAQLHPRPTRRERNSLVLQVLARSNGRPVPVVGTALGAGTGREASRVPNRTAIVGLAVGVAGTVAAIVFGASLDRLTTDPEAFGWSWDVSVANCSTLACADEAAALLDRNADVEAYTGFNEGAAVVDGVRLTGGQFRLGRGWAGGRILEGSPPVGPQDMVLGEATAIDLGAEVGDEVEVLIEGGDAASFRVTGIFVPPAALSDSLTLTQGAGITSAGVRRAAPEVAADLARRVQYYLVRLDPSVDRDEALARLQADFPTTVLGPIRTDDVEGIRRLRHLPALLAALVAGVALLTLVHFVVATARRRRTALATVQALGGGRGLGHGALAWHATLVVVGGVVIGVPVGIVIGRLGWVAAADALEVPVDPVTPGLALAAVVLGVLVAGAALGWGSYRLRAPSPAGALRGD